MQALDRVGEPIHPGLLVTRFVRWAEPGQRDPREWNFKVVEQDRHGRAREEDRKVDNLHAAVRAVRDDEGCQQGRRLRELASAWRARRTIWIKPLLGKGLAHVFSMKTDWRLVVGLAGASPLETSITLHHTFGVPMIPGSGLKGLARAAARLEAKAAECQEVFGTPQCAGLIDVLDAILIPQRDKPLLEVDVMNPHYPLWYRQASDGRGKRIPPSDDQSPNPVFFLTIPAGTEFEFGLLCRTRAQPAKEALARAASWLRAGLAGRGAGAKTAAGYGYFSGSSS